MIFGIKNENTNNPREKKTLREINSPQLPETHTSLTVPIKNVKMNVPTRIPRPVPAKESQKRTYVNPIPKFMGVKGKYTRRK